MASPDFGANAIGESGPISLPIAAAPPVGPAVPLHRPVNETPSTKREDYSPWMGRLKIITNTKNNDPIQCNDCIYGNNCIILQSL